MIERLLAAERALEGGQHEVAERLFAQVAAADPRNAIAVVGLARVAQRIGDTAAATAHARRALEIDPEDGAARKLLDELARPAEAVPARPGAATAEGSSAGASSTATARRRGFLAWLRRLVLGRD
jgi:uncharacterized protein HemY